MALKFLKDLGLSKPSWLPKFSAESSEVNKVEGKKVFTGMTTCQIAPASAPQGQELATFAGGCFWGLQLAFDRVPGVVNSTVGYTGGNDPNPNYNSVCRGRTGHAEAVQVTYDPKEVEYGQLLSCFFEHVDPTTRNRQGGDMGTQYRSAIYYHSEEQREAAAQRFEEVNRLLSKSTFRRAMGSRVVSELAPAGDYFIAEKYHQKYLQKGGRFGRPQSAEKGSNQKIRCYG